MDGDEEEEEEEERGCGEIGMPRTIICLVSPVIFENALLYWTHTIGCEPANALRGCMPAVDPTSYRRAAVRRFLFAFLSFQKIDAHCNLG